MFSASTVLTQLLAMTKGKGCGGLEVLPSLLLPTSQTLLLGSVGEPWAVGGWIEGIILML